MWVIFATVCAKSDLWTLESINHFSYNRGSLFNQQLFLSVFFFLHCYICVSDWNSSKPLELVNNFIHQQDLLTVAPWVSNWVSESFGHNRDLVLSRSVNQLSQWVQWVMFRLIWLAELCKPWNWTNCWTNLNELFNWMDWNDSSHWKDKKKKKLC